MTALQEERKEHYRRKAERLREKAEERFQRSDELTRGIPFGQPILVGHHSEKRHRAAIRKSQDAASKGLEHLEAAKQAEWSESQAGRAILGRDPEAIEAMREKIADLEERRDLMKKINKAYRKGGWEEVGDISPKLEVCPYEKQPFPGWELSNLGANIRRCKRRLQQLEERQMATAGKICHAEYTIEKDPAEDRIRLRFTERLSRDDFKRVRSLGFRWSRANTAFQRHYNNAGAYAVERAVKDVLGLDVTVAL